VKRIVVGAHAGLSEWLAQRGTAVAMALSLVLWVACFAAVSPSGYEAWSQFMGSQWIRVLTFVFFASLAWHAWIGGRDIFMDYIKHDGFRMAKHFGLIVWLGACLVWTAGILWR